MITQLAPNYPVSLADMPPLVVAPELTLSPADEAFLRGEAVLHIGDVALNAMMEQQFAFHDLSLSNTQTQQAIASEKGMNALVANNFATEDLTFASPFTAMAIQHRRTLDILDEEDDARAKARARRNSLSLVS